MINFTSVVSGELIRGSGPVQTDWSGTTGLAPWFWGDRSVNWKAWDRGRHGSQ